MIRASPAWWALRLAVDFGTHRWQVEPERPPTGLWARFADPRWTGRWTIRMVPDKAEPVGSLRVTPNAANVMGIKLGPSAVNIPMEGGSNDTFIWSGRLLRLSLRRERLEQDGKQVAAFGGRGYAVIVKNYQQELEELVGAVAAGIVLNRLITATSMPSGV